MEIRRDPLGVEFVVHQGGVHPTEEDKTDPRAAGLIRLA